VSVPPLLPNRCCCNAVAPALCCERRPAASATCALLLLCAAADQHTVSALCYWPSHCRFNLHAAALRAVPYC
jgi:hypothetical protein